MSGMDYEFLAEVRQRSKLLKNYSVYKGQPGQSPIRGYLGLREKSEGQVLQYLQEFYVRPYDLGDLWAAEYALGPDLDKCSDCERLAGGNGAHQIF